MWGRRQYFSIFFVCLFAIRLKHHKHFSNVLFFFILFYFLILAIYIPCQWLLKKKKKTRFCFREICLRFLYWAKVIRHLTITTCMLFYPVLSHYPITMWDRLLILYIFELPYTLSLLQFALCSPDCEVWSFGSFYAVVPPVLPSPFAVCIFVVLSFCDFWFALQLCSFLVSKGSS